MKAHLDRIYMMEQDEQDFFILYLPYVLYVPFCG